MNEQLPSYFAILTPEVRYNKNLKPIEKIVFAEITALSNLKGYCFATNDYLAKLYDVDSCTISRYISHLEKLSLIKCEYIKDGQIIKERRIYINVVDSSVNGTVDNSVNGTVDNSVKDNNTRVNNTSINNINIPEKTKRQKIQEPKLKFGEFQNVLLSQKEYDKFISKYGKEKTDAFIQYFSERKEMKGYKYASDRAALQNWGITAYENQLKKQPNFQNNCHQNNNPKVKKDLNDQDGWF
ncbi:MAG: helix-turn-helix domain-containing protein [Treponema sp.]|nr:helix-turn-helix domain-containing protein [Treponema sp.]